MAKKDKYKGFVSLSLPLKKSLGFLRRHNYHPALLVINRNWMDIIGEQYYKYCKPERVYFRKNQKGNGILYVVVYSPVLSMYIDSNKRFILDKVNRFFGYQAVADIKIKQTPKIVEEYCKKKVAKNIKKNEKERLLSNLKDDMDEELKSSLKELGENILKYNEK